MKQIAWTVFISVVCLTMGCGRKTETQPAEGEKSGTQVVSNDVEQSETARTTRDFIDRTGAEYDKDLIEKLRNSETPPPRIQTGIEVLAHDKVSVTDAERGWMFQKSAFERCYGLAVTRDAEAKGEARVSIKRAPGSSKVEVVSLTTDIKVEHFEDCLKSAPAHWRLPEGSSAQYRVTFSAKPGLTASEMAQMVPDHRHVDQDHPHETQPSAGQAALVPKPPSPVDLP